MTDQLTPRYDAPQPSTTSITDENACVPGNYSWAVVGKKIAYGLAKAAVALLTGAKGAALMKKWGVAIDPDTLQLILAGTIYSGLVWLHDYFKHKTNSKYL